MKFSLRSATLRSRSKIRIQSESVRDISKPNPEQLNSQHSRAAHASSDRERTNDDNLHLASKE
jgi:hypothetical protein